MTLAKALGIGLLFMPLATPAITPTAVDLVQVNKSERVLRLMSHGQEVARFHIALGGAPIGPKQREGDHRTPEGRYLLDFKKRDSAYFRAIHVSYPNPQDRRRAQAQGASPGSAIMIHGQKNGFGGLSAVTQKYDWTDGCIALSNADMQQVWDRVQVPTPLVISP